MPSNAAASSSWPAPGRRIDHRARRTTPGPVRVTTEGIARAVASDTIDEPATTSRRPSLNVASRIATDARIRAEHPRERPSKRGSPVIRARICERRRAPRRSTRLARRVTSARGDARRSYRRWKDGARDTGVIFSRVQMAERAGGRSRTNRGARITRPLTRPGMPGTVPA